MIINETILEEKFNESDSKGYDYLIDNTENDEQVLLLLELQEAFDKGIDKVNNVNYIQYRNSILESLGLNTYMIK